MKGVSSMCTLCQSVKIHIWINGLAVLSEQVVPNPSPFREWAFGPRSADDGAGHNEEAMRDGVVSLEQLSPHRFNKP